MYVNVCICVYMRVCMCGVVVVVSEMVDGDGWQVTDKHEYRQTLVPADTTNGTKISTHGDKTSLFSK